ncbi:MAG: thioredoxin family protein [Longicatena sp.]
MKLFKKEPKACCGGNCSSETMQKAEASKQEDGVKVLGSACAKCVALEAATKQAMQEMNISLPFSYVTDFAQIASYGVMTTPALVVNGVVKAYGKVLSVEEVKQILLDSGL